MDEQEPSGDPVPENKSMKAGVIVVIILIIAALAFAFWGGKDKDDGNDGTDTMNTTTEEQSTTTEENNETSVETNMETTTNIVVPEVNINSEKVFIVGGDNFKFDLTEMRVKKGDTVKITFTNNKGTHDLLIDEYKVNTGILAAGESKTVEFVADKTGTFEFYCSVGQHRQMGMKGNLIVE